MSTRPSTATRTAAAVLVGLALGATTSGGTALLLYTGQGFLRAAGLLVSSTIMAVAAGLWAGIPESPHEPVRTRARWLVLIVAMLAAGVLSAVWTGRADLREFAPAGALAVLLTLAIPAYASGTLLGGMHARHAGSGTGGVAPGATAGAAFGVLLATSTLIQTMEPYGLYYASAAILSFAAMLDRDDARTPASETVLMHDRVVLITGVAAPGQLAHALARRFIDAGARVAVTSRSTDIEEVARGLGAAPAVLAIRADLLVDDDVARLCDAVRTHFGRLDAVINTAGGLALVRSVADTSAEEWNAEMERNAGTALRVSRAALPLLRESRGVIINFTSPAASRAVADLGAYSAAKAAVASLTRSLAIEEMQHGVRVNAISPGMMDTAQNRAVSGDAAEAAFVPLDDVADVALFLASPRARAVSGEIIHVAGPTLG